MKLDWRQSILYVTTTGIEGCWLFALMALLNNGLAGGRLSVPGILLLYPISFGFNKLLKRRQWHKVYLRSINWLMWAIGMLLMVKIQLFSSLALADTDWLLAVPQAIAEIIYAFKPELLILVSSAGIWWLGQRLAYLRLDFATSVSEFQFGLVILAATFFVASQTGVDLADSVPLILAFFLFALLGISIAHAHESTSWLSGLYQGHWSGLLLVSISLILILGLLISSAVTPDLLLRVLVALKWTLELILGLVMKVIVFIASLLPELERPAELPSAMPAMEPPEELADMWTIPELVFSALRIAFNISWIGLTVVALWRISSQILGWLRRKLAGMAGAEFEPLAGAFRADLLSLLKHILAKLLGFRLPFRFRAKSRSILPEIASVRQLYRQLLRWAAAGGYPRKISQTPHEYLYTLARLLPEAQGDLDFITQQYVSTRYGRWQPTENELHKLRQSWYNIKQNRIKRQSSEHISE